MADFLLFQQVYSILFSKSLPTENHLQHLVGFCEGDGGCCKQHKKGKNTVDFSYRITQRSLKIIDVITETLGIGGKVYPNPLLHPLAPVYRLTFTRKEQVLCFLTLLYGNFRFPDRQKQYDEWATFFLKQNIVLLQSRLSTKLEKNERQFNHSPQKLYQLTQATLSLQEKRWSQALLLVNNTFVSNRPFHPIETESAWFSGFMEAEGTFRCQFLHRKNSKLGYCVKIGIELRQNNGYTQFHALQARFGGYLGTEGKSTRFQIASAKSIAELADYFEKYPLRGRKSIAQSRWLRASRWRNRGFPLPLEDLKYRQFCRIFTSVNFVKN